MLKNIKIISVFIDLNNNISQLRVVCDNYNFRKKVLVEVIILSFDSLHLTDLMRRF